MEIKVLRSFEKDIESINSKTILKRVNDLVEKMEAAESIDEVSGVKKLKGHKAAFRARIGAYRLGFFIEGGQIELVRFVHRKTIYQVFP